MKYFFGNNSPRCLAVLWEIGYLAILQPPYQIHPRAGQVLIKNKKGLTNLSNQVTFNFTARVGAPMDAKIGMTNLIDYLMESTDFSTMFKRLSTFKNW